jgi:hypothetical protein
MPRYQAISVTSLVCRHLFVSRIGRRFTTDDNVRDFARLVNFESRMEQYPRLVVLVRIAASRINDVHLVAFPEPPFNLHMIPEYFAVFGQGE